MAGPVMLSMFDGGKWIGICSIASRREETLPTNGARSCGSQQLQSRSIVTIVGDGLHSKSVPPKAPGAFGSYFFGCTRQIANPSGISESTCSPCCSPSAAAASIRSLMACGLQQTRVTAAARLAGDEPVVCGWHGTEPLSATHSVPVCPHSRTQCGPPTLSSVPSSRVSSCGHLITCLTPIVAASSSSSVFPN